MIYICDFTGHTEQNVEKYRNVLNSKSCQWFPFVLVVISYLQCFTTWYGIAEIFISIRLWTPKHLNK